MNTDPTDRYARQIRFAPIGDAGQERLSAATVAIVGLGALGTVASEILARAGVGTLRLVDRDVVEWTNLQRQSLFEESDARSASAKAPAAAARLAKINSSIRIEPEVVDLDANNIEAALEADLVVDATDNFAVRFLINDWSLKHRTPWVHGGCVGGSGQVMVFTGGVELAGEDGATGEEPPCFRCLVPQPPPAAAVDTCDTAGVVGAATHAIASLQAIEAIKWLTGSHDAVRSRVWSLDFWNNRSREVALTRRVGCRACGGFYDFLDGDAFAATDVLCGRDAVQIGGDGPANLSRYAERWRTLGRVESNRFFVRLRIDHQPTLTLFRDGRVVVDGTTDVAAARSLKDRYVGG